MTDQQRVLADSAFATNFNHTLHAYIDITDDLVAGTLLSQIVYWHTASKDGSSKLKIKKNGNYWLVKSREDWQKEIRISAKQYDRAIKILKNKKLVVVELHRFNNKPTPYIRLIYKNLEKETEKWKANWIEEAEKKALETSKHADFDQRVKTDFDQRVKSDFDQKGKSTITEITCTENTKQRITSEEYQERTSEEDAPLLSPHDEIGIDNKEWEWQSEYQYKTYMENRMPEFVWSIVHDGDFIDKKHAHRVLVAVTTEYFKQYSRKTGKLHPWYSEKHLRECFDELFEYGGGNLSLRYMTELMKEFFKHDGARDYHFKVFATKNMLRYCEALIDQDTETLMAFNDGEYAFS